MNNDKTNIIFDSKDMSLSVTTIMDNNLKVKVKDCYFKNVVEITKDTAIHSFDIDDWDIYNSWDARVKWLYFTMAKKDFICSKVIKNPPNPYLYV